MPTKIFITELVNAFNLNNYFSDNIYTNFTVQDGAKGKNDKIVSLFGCDGNIKKYLKEIREEITRQHYSNEEAAGGFYNLNSFPFVFNVDFDKKGKFISKNVKVVELANLMDSEVIHNLKLHFANEFQEHVEAGVTGELETMGMTRDEALKCVRKSVQLERVDKLSPYLYCISFGEGYFKEIGHPNPSRFLELFRNVYVAQFNLRLERCGLNDSSIFYEQRDNKLYIKDITDINVIKDIVRYVKERIALDFKTSGDVDSKVENCKDAINDLIFTVTGKFIEGYEYDVFTNKDKIKSGHSFALIPLVEVNGQVVPLSEEDAYKVKKKFYEILGDVVFSNIKGETKDELGQISSSQGPVYAFSNKQIARLLPIIMESPIAYNQISGCFEFAVDLTNFKRRGSSRSSSTVNSPTHAGQSGLRTPPNQRDRDSGYDSNSPPKPKDSVAHSSSGDPGPSSKISHSQVSPSRQGSILRHDVGAAEVGAAANMPAWTSASFQPMDRWSLPVFYAQSSDISVPRFQPPTQLSSSGPSSWKGADPVGANPWAQPIGYWSSQSSNLKEDCKKICEDFEEAYEKIVSDSSLSKEEQELFKALLYTLNLMNYTFDGIYTNFFAKDGKIVSFLHENVDREKYLQAVRDYIIEKYCETEEEARKVYDLDEFPFKLNYEEKQGKTVVANISSGALSNLKILFSQKFGKNVDAIDISAVKKVEKREKDKWVDRQESKGCSLKDACISCFPDEGVMKQISITFDKEDDEYLLNRSCDICEVRLLYKMQQRAKDTSKAGKGKPEDNKDSGYSSGFVTDAENVSSKAEATTSGTSGYESMDCENTRKRSLQHKSPSPEDGGSPRKSSRSGSNNSSSEEAGGSPRSNFSDSDSEGLCKELHKTGISKW